MQKRNFFSRNGFTLVETLVALAIFTLGIAATVLIFSKTVKNKAYALEMGKSAFVVSRSMGDLTQYLRRARQSDAGSYPIVSAKDNDLVIYSDYDKDGKTEQLHIYLSNGIVYLDVHDPSAAFPPLYAPPVNNPNNGTTVVLAKQIVNTPTDPMFSYFDKDYPQSSAVATPADVSEIRLIKLFLKINIDPNRAPDNIQQETFIEIRNLNDYDRIH